MRKCCKRTVEKATKELFRRGKNQRVECEECKRKFCVNRKEGR